MYSLSEKHDNNHQWAMYADDGRGFCIEYEIKPKNKDDLKLITSLLPICYGKKTPFLISKLISEWIETIMQNEDIDNLIYKQAELAFIQLYKKIING